MFYKVICILQTHQLDNENAIGVDKFGDTSKKIHGPQRKNNHFRRSKPGKNNRGLEDKKREADHVADYEMVCSYLENIGDPYDDMNLEEKKRLAIYHFYRILKVAISLCTLKLLFNIVRRLLKLRGILLGLE